MKKLFVLLLVLLLTAMTGCSFEKSAVANKVNNSESETEKTTENMANDTETDNYGDIEVVEELPSINKITESREEDKEEIIPLDIDMKLLEYNAVEDGINYAKVYIEYPVIKNTLSDEYYDGIVRINEFFYESALALYEENKIYADDKAAQLKEEAALNESAKADEYCTYTITYDVTYNRNGYLSLTSEFSEYEYLMAHPNYYSTGYVFDVLKGERLQLSDILNGNTQEINAIIEESFLNNSELGIEVLEESYDEIKDNVDYVKFYIDNERLILFFDPDVVAPYAVGTVRAFADFTKEELFKVNFK